ncbi:hypothetical protein AYO41_04245 [Verrucomicrobia bacterium SCGC AG-212-E04]|nr:hypothetical protein AYO41_04245 [Verrucomicrobia bacterium SCGC AG-212-E04]
MKLAVQNRLMIGDAYWDFERPILDAHRIGDRIVVIFDYMSFPKAQQARNLMAYDMSQKLLWVAEHPTSGHTDTYVSIISESPLRVGNFASYTCEIDVETGKLRDAVFTK